MIKHLFLFDLKENKIPIIAITSILLLYGSISVGMYDPNSTEALQAMLDIMPEAMVNMMGFANLGTNMAEYISNYLYGFIFLMFPAIYIIILGTRLLSAHNDKGNLTYLITMPYTRTQLIVTQIVFYISSLLTAFIVNIGVIILMSVLMFPGKLDIGLFLMVNLVTFGVTLLMTSICFLGSVIFSDSSKSFAFSSGIVFPLIVIKMISSISDKTDFLKYFSPYSLIDVTYILEGDGHGTFFALFTILIAIILYIVSVIIFNKKSIIV